MIYFLETEAEKILYETELDHSEHVVDLEEDRMDQWIFIELGWAHLLILKANLLAQKIETLQDLGTCHAWASSTERPEALTKSKPLDTAKNWKSPKYEKKQINSFIILNANSTEHLNKWFLIEIQLNTQTHYFFYTTLFRNLYLYFKL